MNHNPNLMFITTTGSKYYVDEINHTISGGRYNNSISYDEKNFCFIGAPASFKLSDGSYLETSVITHMYSLKKNLERPQEPQQKSNIMVCTTRSGSNYIIDIDNSTVKGGIFGNTPHVITAPLAVEIGKTMSIWTNNGCIVTSNVDNIQTLEHFQLTHNMNLENENDLQY